jgi:altronate hydrolase
MDGYIRHVNFAGVLLIGLGCETNLVSTLMESGNLRESVRLRPFTIQDTGGTRATIERGIAMVREMLPEANRVSRQPVPASHLTLALQCGGSDGYSGISANPAMGAAVDLLVEQGGTAILAETPEIYGAEHLLTRRAVSREIGQKLVDRIHWWEQYTARTSGEMDNNPSPGNKAGGLTTILEKSLGAAAKGGTCNLADVVEYAQPVKTRGLVFMDSPGYDPVSVTGEVASGANIVCFTTGRGSVFGCKPSPSIKLATNTTMYRRMQEDMDFNCGEILDGNLPIQEAGQQIFQMIIECASGKPSKSEAYDIGEDEFAPWVLGPTM